MHFEDSLAFATKMDRKDPLKKYARLFHRPRFKRQRAIYFCGNSLGLQPRAVSKAFRQELKEWKNLAIEGYWNAKHPWLFYHDTCKPVLAKMTGAGLDEVTVMNALTVNLHLLLTSFYRPTGDHYKILMEAGAFPSDQYAIATQVKLHGHKPSSAIIEIAPRKGEKLLRTEDILHKIAANKNSLALVMMGGINYYTGQLYDLKAITAAAHKAGALAGFDLAHVTGNVPLRLHDWKVDFAVWCSYKYLNGGPGAAGGIFVNNANSNNARISRLGGWWGNDESTRFQMEKTFRPKTGADGWQLSTTQVFNMVALRASLEIFKKAGIKKLHRKSIQLTAYLEFLLQKLKHLDFEIITPSDPEQRGAQLSLYFKKDAKAIHQQMIDNGIVVDYREPGVIRVAPAPLYNSFREVFRFFQILESFKLSES